MTVNKKSRIKEGWPRTLSGIRPTGELHLGNYLGALLHFEAMKGNYQGFYFLADLHALTTERDPDVIRKATFETAAMYMAIGLDKHAVIFKQSDIRAHSEMAWLLNTIANMGELRRMVQFKEKSAEALQGEVPVGLFDYPVLMAADILLYRPEVIPVGQDQKQHVELAQKLAKRFNHHFKPVLQIPEIHISNEGGKIMALDNPNKKMSKSGRQGSYIALLDDEEAIRRKIAKATTGLGLTVRVNSAESGIRNLINIYKLCNAKTPTDTQLRQKFDGLEYSTFKNKVADQVVKWLKGIQTDYAKYEKNPKLVEQRLKEGARDARLIANRTLRAAQVAMGLR